MVSDDELRRLLRDREAANVERAASRADRDKFGEAICAFANELPDLRAPGYLIVGANDDGTCANTPIDQSLIQTLLGFRSDGTITPFPVIAVDERVLDGCRLVVVEVQPSESLSRISCGTCDAA
jgi:ATP-dependent DNA helicase RecG